MTPQPVPSPQSGEPSPRPADPQSSHRRPSDPLSPDPRDTVVALSPFEEPQPRIVIAAERAGSLGLLDLGRDPAAARAALAELARRLGPGRRHGVRVPAGCPLGPQELPAEVDTVLLADPAEHTAERVAAWAAAPGRPRIWAETTGLAEARAAVAAGAGAVVAKGHEGGGRVGGATTFVLLQQLLAGPGIGVPVIACGGIGPHTAAAAVAGGAAGVLVDVQLALTSEGEAGLPAEVTAAVRAMDGSETRLVDGHRVYARPDLPPIEGPAAALLGARDLRAQLLPVGQDAAAAARLAARHRTTGGVLRAIRAAVTGHLAAAARSRPLMAARPVAQGPMTRVSDQAAFAEAVAAAGGVPYLALAVMEGPDVRRLLAETSERLGDRPWGVGLLGFAPAELRREQLAAVAATRPPYAIIAGGTPAQAAPLESAGTLTHLHVPSPGLLERYLAEGARRFVFEGLECGGHVGPRASFPLWEEQIERLLACPEPEALDVLFAGGIHDERSAAMAAAAAAPLAERGARIGVLMGTAYLFTEEAVAAGAVTPRFQRAALDCADTVLLHTAPGHATRCADTPYAHAFEETRQRLAQGGTEPREMWEELERLNLGRLRIASKGLRRGESARLEAVDEERQYAEGLFMLGQAATLRGGTTTVAALHAQVTEGATRWLERRARELAGAGEPASGGAADPLDIAIVGMACAYPGAPDLAAYWAQILDGRDAVTEVPAERWDPALYYDTDPARAGERTPSRWGGFLDPVPFDALAHGIPPSSLAGIEPVQLLALEISGRALADAGYGKEREFDRSRTSVVFGAEAGTELAGAYGLRALHPAYLGELPPALDEQLPRLTEDSFPGILANVIAGRVANRLDLGGANCTVDAACASSLAALDLSCRQLRDGDSDMVLCGGADVHNGINDYLLFASVRALSPGGRCRPFDSAADGIALGEGVGALVLKRLADAERDGDRVYAVIKAVGASSDGRSLGLTAPRPEGQRRALERAYARAGVSPREVGLVEAHGTGTVVGDSTELGVLSKVFTEAGAGVGSCALGSVKSQLGHTKCAAGLAGLIKAARAVHAGVRPPTLHIERPNPAWRAETSPFVFDTEARPWAVPVERRIAGVSAFGFGGTNYHAVLAGYAGAQEPEQGREDWLAELFCFRGEDRRAAGRAMARLAARLEENDAAGRPWALRDLASEACAAGSGPVRVAVVAAGLDELAARLERARGFTAGEGVHVREESADPGRVAFLFPGQGSQRVGMLGDLYMAFPGLRGLLDSAPEPVVSAVFPPAVFTAEERTAQREAVTDTRVAQPALGLAGAAAHLLLGRLGVRPDCVAGHSYGELTALWAAGAYDTESLLRLSTRRAEAIRAAAGEDPGAMAAVSAAPDEVREIAERAGCVVANHNAPRQCAISGPTEAVAAAVESLRAAGVSAQPLPVACAFHSPVVAEAAAGLATELAGTVVADAAVPVWSNTTASPYPADADGVRALLSRQVAEPVRFVEEVEAMYAAGVRTFVEVGPGRVLSGLVGRILADRPHTVVPLDVPGEHGLARLVTALAELAAAGVRITPEPLFRGRTSPLPDRAPRRPGWLVDGHLTRTADGTPVPGGLRPPRRVDAPAPAAAPASAGAAVPAPAAAAAATGFTWETAPDARPAPAAVPAVMPGAAWQAEPAPAGAAAPGPWLTGDPAPYPAPALSTGAAWPPSSDAGSASAPGQAPDGRHEVVLEYLRGSRELIDAQRAVLLGYLGTAPAPATVPVPAGGPADTADTAGTRAWTGAQAVGANGHGPAGAQAWPPGTRERANGHVQTGPAGAPARTGGGESGVNGHGAAVPAGAGAPAGAEAPGTGEPVGAGSAEEVMEAVLEIVHTRTGYPRDMLDPELDLEADLSIDSIKRVEIIGALADRIGLPTDPGSGSGESAVEELSRIKTLRGIVDWVTSHTAAQGPAPAASEPPSEAPSGAAPATPALATPVPASVATAPAAPTAAAAPASPPAPAAAGPAAPTVLRRMRVEEVPVAAADGGPGVLRGLRIAVVDDGQGVAPALCGALDAHGAHGEVVARADAGFDAVVDLSALRAGQEPVLPDAFPGYKRALTGGVRRLLLGSAPGSGLHGFARSAALEFPGTLVRAVDLHPKEDPARMAAQLVAELCDEDDGLSSAGYTAQGLRITRRPVPAPLGPSDETPGVTLGRSALGPGSVVLLTGGARGITARTAVALARATGCHVELVGRTPEPEGQEDGFVHAGDRVALRAALIGSGLRTPAEIEAAASRILAEREVRATLAALAGAAASVRYHCADVTDAQAVRAVVADVRARHGRLDGIVHGAGTLRDGLLADKEPAVFAEVFATKVAGARNLAAAAAEHGGAPAPAFLALFGSVAGVYGNRGQSDYAAANDALDGLALTWADSFPGRVLSVDWGPWAAEAGGMVTPELERAYARRGIPLISPEAGTAAFLAELAYGGDVQVVLMAEEGSGHE
ncbi:SDR family NAD(P)-dependent oxidoreductase [Streptomyces vinaceus]|uniref:SDR family NAD(P)-dependent oxidoreductase n=1 Tax=Streptomyces vinaceus TaxID=1960 RepID=UPI0035E272D7